MMKHFKLSQQSILGLYTSIVAALSFITLLSAIWQWHNDWKLAHLEVPMSTSKVNINETISMIALIPDTHLFGKSLVKIGEVPVTNLQLSVTGIVKVDSENNHSSSKAYISTSGQPSKIYQIGDSLPTGGKIYDINSNEVILENEGQLEKLPLPREQLKFKPKNALE